MRYFQPKEYEYVSQYTPAMMELDYRKGQELLKQEDAFNKDLFDAKNKFIIPAAGDHSKQEDVDKVNNYFTNNLSNISNDINSGKLSAREGINRIQMLSNLYNTDKSVRGLKTDYTLTQARRAEEASGKLDNGTNALGTYFYSNGVKEAKKYDANQLEDLAPSLYNHITPGNMTNKVNEILKEIKPNTLTEEDKAKGFDGIVTRNIGGVNTYWKTSSKNSKITEAVDPSIVHQHLTNWVNANYNTDSDPNTRYARALGKTPEQFVEDLHNSYTGEYKKVIEKTDKSEAQVNVGSGSGVTEEEPNNGPSYPMKGAEQPYKPKLSKLYDIPMAVDKLAIAKNKLLGVNTESIKEMTNFYTTQTKTGPFVDLNMVQPNQLDKKSIETHWVKNLLENKYPKEYNLYTKGQDIPQEKLREIYSNLEDILLNAGEQNITTNNTGVNITYNPKAYSNKTGGSRENKIWLNHVGVRSSNATVADVVKSTVGKNKKIYNLLTGEVVNPKELIESNGKNLIPSITDIQPENMLEFTTGDVNFKKGISFTTDDGDVYVVPDHTVTRGEVKIHDMYQKAKVALGEPVKENFFGTNITYSIDTDNKVYLNSIDGQVVTNNNTFESITDLTTTLANLIKQKK